ncbi:MAG TPA: cytochrome c3 family protein [Spirochaetota bacterium]|nr:cytochrome c3 family protein [Spirochaetota bacterium]HQO02368.1 cytochrome c3 family protein [Spirochaetota bacterium]HQP49660.1 cytochrome c3 family protein [Spirochaetota bacterium]
MKENNNKKKIMKSADGNSPGGMFMLFRNGSRSGSVFAGVSFIIIVITAFVIVSHYTDEVMLFSENVSEPAGVDTLKIDGNRDGRFVMFSHKNHIQRTGEKGKGCVQCHHITMPDDSPVSCAKCHRSMDRVSSVFNHDYHINRFNRDYHISRGMKSGACVKCHTGDKSKDNVVSCRTCHKEYTRDIGYYKNARGYKEALHVRCFQCHDKESAKTEGGDTCTLCHDQGSLILE